MELTIEFIKNTVIATEDIINRSKIIKRIIETYQGSIKRSKMETGQKYYEGKHVILADPKRINKIVVNVNKVITDQKVGYINMSAVKADVVPSKDDNVTEGEEKGENSDLTLAQFDASLQNQLDKKERLKFHNLHTSSSAKGVEWLHYFLDKDGNFATKIIDGVTVIEIRNKEGDLEMIIRFYLRDEWNGDSFDKLYVVEIWDSQMSWVFREKKETNEKDEEYTIFVLDDSLDINPSPHIIHTVNVTLDAYYSYIREKQNENVVPFIDIQDFTTPDANVTVHGWGMVPFSPLYNNQEKEGDIFQYKSMQDDLNKNVSDISNNFDDMQEIISFTRGFEEMLTDNDGERLDQVSAARIAQYMIKQAKHINLPAGKDEDGDFGFKTVDIPVEKRYEHIEQLLSMMYMVAMAVSPKQLMESTVTTGVGITKLFSLLDIKANNNTAYIELMLEDYGGFFARYFNVKEDTEFTKDNILWIMTKNRLMNTKEMVEVAILLSQIVSRKTVLETLPTHIVESVAEEMDRILTENGSPTGEEL